MAIHPRFHTTINGRNTTAWNAVARSYTNVQSTVYRPSLSSVVSSYDVMFCLQSLSAIYSEPKQTYFDH